MNEKTDSHSQFFYPNVLIITNSSVNDTDAHGAFLKNYFSGWPKEKLAHLYQTTTGQHPGFDVNQRRLGPKDRRFGWLYSTFKKSFPILPKFVNENETRTSYKRYFTRLALLLFRKVVFSGVQDLIFSPRCSKGLNDWIVAFKPDVIYIQGYSIFYLKIALLLSKKHIIPLCIHTLDDWPKFAYRGSLFSFILRRVTHYYFLLALKNSCLRICTCREMANEYKDRYGYDFEYLFNCDDQDRFDKAQVKRVVDEKCFSIIYSGSIGLRRWESLIDLSNALKLFANSEKRPIISVFTPEVPPDAADLLSHDNIRIFKSLNDDSVPSIFKGADLLFLCESFDPFCSEYVRLSIATKAHLYMMAGIPILAYGPSKSGVISYAEKSKWAHVVNVKDIDVLSRLVGRLISDHEFCKSTVSRGYQVAYHNHSAKIVRYRFHYLLYSHYRLNASN